MPAESLDAGPEAVGTRVCLTHADPQRRLRGVRLHQQVGIAADRLDFAWDGGRWTLPVSRPGVDRIEYLLELQHRDGRREVVTDPANPVRAPGAFGDTSVLELPGYRPPWWVGRPSPAGREVSFGVPAPGLAATVRCRLWSPPEVDDAAPLPLLVAHDGPEYDELAGLTSYLSVLVRDRRVPSLRAALLSPGPRDDWYSANGAYTRALCLGVLPALRTRVAVSHVIGMGASLGALAMLHAQRRHPGALDALFLQSGSFFQPRFDSHEHRFAHYDRVVRTVATVLRSGQARCPVPAVMTCGVPEENLANNRVMARALAAQGYDVALHELRDGHNYVAWRDAFDPHLTRLLRGEPPCRTPS